MSAIRSGKSAGYGVCAVPSIRPATYQYQYATTNSRLPTVARLPMPSAARATGAGSPSSFTAGPRSFRAAASHRANATTA